MGTAGSKPPQDGAAADEYPVEKEGEYDEINKRTIGKFIIKCCGNEGLGDEEDNRLRRLLQGAISHLEKEKPDVWKNAELTVYDKYANCYTMKAGMGQYKFLVHLDGRDEIEVICTDKPSMSQKLANWWSSSSKSDSSDKKNGSTSSANKSDATPAAAPAATGPVAAPPPDSAPSTDSGQQSTQKESKSEENPGSRV
ncbi:uncharacterized protein LOC144435820 [Glandiceps talaboti]